jgi:hypothetical protein
MCGWCCLSMQCFLWSAGSVVVGYVQQCCAVRWSVVCASVGSMLTMCAHVWRFCVPHVPVGQPVYQPSLVTRPAVQMLGPQHRVESTPLSRLLHNILLTCPSSFTSPPVCVAFALQMRPPFPGGPPPFGGPPGMGPPGGPPGQRPPGQ